MITQAELHDRLHYDPQIGLFWWKPKPPTSRANRAWNTRHAGQIAGTRLTVGYGSIIIDRKPYYVHRLAWIYMTGEWPTETIDHRNGWRLDNAFNNLRTATYSQNNVNRSSRRTTALKGAYRVGHRWRAQINHPNGPSEHLGYHDTMEQAHAAFMKRSLELHGQFHKAA